VLLGQGVKVVTWGFTNIDDFARFLKLFGDFLPKTEWKLAEIGGFWVLFENPRFQAKKGVEKSRVIPRIF
jgi:hypothetical protein